MPSVKPKYLVISGATASGKTSSSITLAKKMLEQKIQVEIVNFDSLLFYKHLNIGTAKPSKEEQAGIPHHLIDINEVTEPLNASSFVKICLPVLEKIWQQEHIPLLVGGSGFYLNALLEGMFPGGTPSEEAKKKVANLLQEKGLEAIISELKQVDPKSAMKIHANDEYRLTRALEFYYHSGESISAASERFEKEKEGQKLGLKRQAQGLHFYLSIPKEEHLPYIYERTKQMLNQGLLTETKEILQQSGISGDEKPLQSIGYKQAIAFLRGEIKAEEELEERINIATRRLAKAQKTWFATHPADFTLDPRSEQENIVAESAAFLKN